MMIVNLWHKKEYFAVASRSSFLRVIFRCELFEQSAIKLEAHEYFMVKGKHSWMREATVRSEFGECRSSQMWRLLKLKLHKITRLVIVEVNWTSQKRSKIIIRWKFLKDFEQRIRDCANILFIDKNFHWVSTLKISRSTTSSSNAGFLEKSIRKRLLKHHATILLLFFGDLSDPIRFLAFNWSSFLMSTVIINLCNVLLKRTKEYFNDDRPLSAFSIKGGKQSVITSRTQSFRLNHWFPEKVTQVWWEIFQGFPFN